MTVGAPLAGALRRRIVFRRAAALPGGKGLGNDQRWAGPRRGEGDHKGRPYEAVGAGAAVGAGYR